MLCPKLDEFGETSHAAILIHDLADHAGRLTTREPRKVNTSLGLTRSYKDTARTRAQREDVPRPHQLRGLRLRVR